MDPMAERIVILEANMTCISMKERVARREGVAASTGIGAALGYRLCRAGSLLSTISQTLVAIATVKLERNAMTSVLPQSGRKAVIMKVYIVFGDL